MRIVSIGRGPAGLYLALLMKKADEKGSAVTRREEPGPRGAMTENGRYVIYGSLTLLGQPSVTTGGILSAQGAAASKAAAARSAIASCRRRPTI